MELKQGRDYIGVGGGVLILDEQQRVLLMKRSEQSKNEAGYWSKPGGTVEFGESVAEAMIREVFEEVGVEIEIIGYLPHTDHILANENQHWAAFNLIGKIVCGEPKNLEPHKCCEIGWFELDNLPEKSTQTVKQPVADYLAGRFIKL